VRLVVALLLSLVLAGCGVPSEPSKQAEEIGSLAAEGALLAHDAAEGSTTATFTRVHAEALGKALRPLRPKLRREDLQELAADVARGLDRLAADPGDQADAARIERELKDAAKQAEELAG
jgi:hypothetical protein